MLNRKVKRPKIELGEENGLFQNDKLLEYQNKSLCTLIIDLREKLKSKEELYDNLSSRFNSTINFLNIFTSTINALNEDITKALSKNKISIKQKEEEKIKEKKKIFLSVSEFLNDIISKEKLKKEEKQKEKEEKNTNNKHHTSNNKIIIDNSDDIDMKEDQNIESVNDLQKEIEKEYEPMIKRIIR